MAFVVEMVQIFKFSMWKAARLSFAFSCNSHFRAIQHFSAQKKEPSQSASLTEFGNEGNEHHHGSHQCPISGLGDAAQVIPKPCPPGRSYKGLIPPNNRRWQWKSSMRSTRQAASSSEEFRNLREDDFSKEGKRPGPKPLSIERTKGSEILYGIAPCSLAFSQSKRDFFRLFLKSSSSCIRPVMEEFAQQAKARGVPVHHVRRQVLDALCKGQVHQGVCLEATPLCPRCLEKAEPSQVGVATGLGTQQIWLVLEQIQDPMNLGAMLRSAHFLGVDRVVISQKDSCPLTPTVSKASAGAMEVLEVYSTDNLQRFLKAKTEEGWEIMGTVSKSEVEDNVPVINCLEFHWNKPTILILGGFLHYPLKHQVLVTMEMGYWTKWTSLAIPNSEMKGPVFHYQTPESSDHSLNNITIRNGDKKGNEGYGLSSKTRSLCHRMLIIPPGRMLQPGIESLNVSVATGILLHCICSQKIK